MSEDNARSMCRCCGRFQKNLDIAGECGFCCQRKNWRGESIICHVKGCENVMPHVHPNADGSEPIRQTSKSAKQPDLDYAVFSTDPRVLERARLKYEVDGADAQKLAEAVGKLWTLGLDKHMPEAEWVREAQLLGERIGKPWYETPERTIVEALSRSEDLMPLPFPETMIAGGTSIHLMAEPQCHVRGRRLVVDDVSASKLRITEIRAGNMSIVLGYGRIPCDLFKANAFPFRLDLPESSIGSRITLFVENISCEAVKASFVMLCERVDEKRMRWGDLIGRSPWSRQ